MPLHEGSPMNQIRWIDNWARLRSQRTRRILVALMVILLVLAVRTPIAGIVCMLLYFPLSRSGIPPMDDKSPVDERQWRVRAEATTIAYRILAVATLVLVLIQPVRPEQWDTALFAVTVLIVCLPLAVLAWREPDPPQDEA